MPAALHIMRIYEMMCSGQPQSANHIESVNSESPSFSFSDRREMSKGFMLNHDMTEKQKD